jgi:sugar phosphate isomerase/epimerase
MNHIWNISVIMLATGLFMACMQKQNENEFLLEDIGIVSYSFRQQFSEDVPGTLNMIKGLGVSNIEFSNLFGLSATALREMLDERKMICTSYGVGYETILNDTDNVISDARTLGAKYVRVASIPHERTEAFTIDHAKKAVDDFNRVGEMLKNEGLIFLYHNHGFEFRPYDGGTLFDYIVQNTNPEFVNFQLDVAWVVHPAHDPVQLLEMYPDRFYLTHLKDLSTDIEHNFSGWLPKDSNVLFGTGLVDFEAFLKASQKTNIEYHFIEYEDSDVVEVMPGNIEFIKSIKSKP